MSLLHFTLMSLLALSGSANAWSLTETDSERIARVEAEKQARVAQVHHYQATGHVKSNFRLESSHSALKEARKTLTWFVLAYPALAYALNYFDATAGSSYYRFIPHSVLALFIVWGAENILRGQVELNKQQYVDLSALAK